MRSFFLSMFLFAYRSQNWKKALPNPFLYEEIHYCN